MTRDEMIQLAEPATFRPFTIVTGSGESFKVPHADFIDIPPLGENEAIASYVTVYTTGKAAIPQLIVLANIQEIKFQKKGAR